MWRTREAPSKPGAALLMHFGKLELSVLPAGPEDGHKCRAGGACVTGGLAVRAALPTPVSFMQLAALSLQGLKTDTDAEREAHATLQAELLQQHPGHLPLLRERLSRLEQLTAKVGLGCSPDENVGLRDWVIHCDSAAAVGAAGWHREAGRKGLARSKMICFCHVPIAVAVLIAFGC